MKHSISVLILLCMFMAGSTAYGSASVPIPGPEEPRINDPDISALTDQRLIQFWNEIIVECRRSNPATYDPDPDICGLIPPETQEYLITALERELHGEPIDWNSVYAMVRMMVSGMNSDARIPELGRFMLQLPRVGKMSNNRAMAYARMLGLLGMQQSMEAAALLCEAAGRDFWGDDPMYKQPSKRDSEYGIYLSRYSAVSALVRFMPKEISVPALEDLSEKYPPLPVSDKSYDARIGRDIHVMLSRLLKE